MGRRGDSPGKPPGLRRRLYRGGRPGRLAGLLNRMQAALASAGIGPERVRTLEVRGRRSGPHDLVAGGRRRARRRALLRRDAGRSGELAREREGRGRPGGTAPPRAHIPVDRKAPVAEFEPVADRYPVFRIRRA